MVDNFDEDLERILETVVSFLAYATPLQADEHKYLKGYYGRKIIFALQHYEGVFAEWNPILRWAMNPLEEYSTPSCLTHLRHSKENTLDNLEAFETLIENCSKSLPISASKSNIYLNHRIH